MTKAQRYLIRSRIKIMKTKHVWRIEYRGALVEGAYRCFACGLLSVRFWLCSNEMGQQVKLGNMCARKLGLEPNHYRKIKLIMPSEKEKYWYQLLKRKAKIDPGRRIPAHKAIIPTLRIVEKALDDDLYRKVIADDLSDSIDLFNFSE